MEPIGSERQPPGREANFLISSGYDSTNNRLIVFGGARLTDRTVLNDVWVLMNANGLGGTPTWTQLSPTGQLPSPRVGSSGFYDVGTNRLAVFGGTNGGLGAPFAAYNDLWVLNNANGLGGTPVWQQVMPSGLAITPHINANAEYDALRNRMVLFGGYPRI